MLKAWNFKTETTFTDVAENVFQVFFNTPNAKDHVTKGGPWLFDDHLFLFKPWTPEIRLSELHFPICNIWVQVYGLPLHCRTWDTVKKIWSNLGPILEAKDMVRTDRVLSCKFKRVRVAFNTDKPAWSEGEALEYGDHLLADPSRKRDQNHLNHSQGESTHLKADNPAKEAGFSEFSATLNDEMMDENCDGIIALPHTAHLMKGEGMMEPTRAGSSKEGGKTWKKLVGLEDSVDATKASFNNMGPPITVRHKSTAQARRARCTFLSPKSLNFDLDVFIQEK
ncbi:hypothetical protein Scep_014406 [Stephania cephalantha]|uniref:DUF4283 domain-containing protein n=1 Tax=Stephania cephalantha TaxID=152367 RepID=A0AAP0P1N6_9MAGN